MRVYIDHTHVWRKTTGVERVSLQLFSPEVLAPLDAVPIRARDMRGMLLTQTIGLPACLARSPSSILLCPGFPPQPLLHLFGRRVIPYVHDVFLLSRREDLNWRAKAYSAWPFGMAVRRLKRFLVNSHDTAGKLAEFCRDDAEAILYRPTIRNNFALSAQGRAERPFDPRHLKLVAVGTVEPRKNLLAAAAIVGALRERGSEHATLEIVGRRGWGDDWDQLEKMPGVVLHGYKPDADAAGIVSNADILVCTSHEEGLGLPLLEAQYAGLPVVAPAQPVFHEALGDSGIFIDPSEPVSAADRIAALVRESDWRAAHVARADGNLRRWNALADADRARVVTMLMRLGRRRQ